ncbi:MAG: PEP-utilizing enzyme [Patescibacteria group bacterium]|nr:hypothetical protein [Patescibacteria group bacterium]
MEGLFDYISDPTISYVRVGKPYPNFWGESHTHPHLKSLHGTKVSYAVYLYFNGDAYYFVDKKGIARVKEIVYKKLLLKPNHISHCLEKTDSVISEGESFFQFVLPNIKKYSNDKIELISKKFHKLLLQIQMYADSTYYMSESILNENLLKRLESHFSKDSEKIGKVVKVLTAFDSLSYLEREDLSLAQIALANDQSSIINHISLWRHKTFDYWGPETTEKEFYDRLKSFRKQPTRTRATVSRYTNAKKSRQRMKKGIIKRYNLPGDIVLLSRLVSQVGFLNDTKKYSITRLTYLFDKFLDEIVRRFGIEKELIYYHLPLEIEGIGRGDQPVSEKELRERRMLFVIVFSEGKEIMHTTDKGSQIAQELLKIIGTDLRLDSADEESTSCSGIPASKGEYEGTVVKMFSHKDLHKARDGMVLVSPKTTVDFISALYKAGAVVTDYGGLTSHTAIVAREMNIPGIVGTKTATTAFSDGDVVCVDGEKGIAKLVKKRSHQKL